MGKMANAAEVIERLARECERLKLENEQLREQLAKLNADKQPE